MFDTEGMTWITVSALEECIEDPLDEEDEEEEPWGWGSDAGATSDAIFDLEEEEEEIDDRLKGVVEGGASVVETPFVKTTSA